MPCPYGTKQNILLTYSLTYLLTYLPTYSTPLQYETVLCGVRVQANACKYAVGQRSYMASPQCLEGTGTVVTEDLCFPSDEEVLKYVSILSSRFRRDFSKSSSSGAKKCPSIAFSFVLRVANT